ncbi:MAG: DUF3127 domain-containing protein [Bacteroidales bacterium]|nr:DUF3127 domain-containing protein [Bacteroidales bacterium]MBD5209211.1 DUF3127 domain-containing protein [Bacteroidales bacterium]
MELEGKIIQELPLQEGVSKAGRPWKKREWVLETFGNYPRTVKFHVFGDRADTMNIEVGKTYSLSIDIESREYAGRWYTDVSAFAAREIAPAAPQTTFGAPAAPAAPGVGSPIPPVAPATDFMPSSDAGNDDLPF